jgi:cytochrome c oxidase subunit II
MISTSGKTGAGLVFGRWMLFIATVISLGGATLPASAQLIDRQPSEIQEVGIDEKLGEVLPLDLAFRNERGEDVTLGDLFHRDRPVILTLNYSDCPMLCMLQLNGLVDGLLDVSLLPGKDFEILSVSIDPTETPERALLTKQRYVKAYGRPESASGWHFWVGRQANIQRLADAVGFRYKYIPERSEYSHAAVLMFCSPNGTITRYLYGVLYEPRTLHLTLIEAGEGKIGSTLDRILLFCFHYDATVGRYGPVAQRLMRLAAGLTLFVLVIGLVPVWLRRSARSATPKVDSADSTPTGSGTADSSPPDSTSPADSKPPGGSASILPMFPLPLAQTAYGSNFFFPERASDFAGPVDTLFFFILWVSMFFFAIIVGVMTFFLLKYRHREGVEPEESPSHSNFLEILWSVIPALIVGVIFIWGYGAFLDMRQPPANAYEIRVVARKWTWEFVYANGHRDPDLHVPVNRPVQLLMSSEDVIHSLFIPAFRVKMDVLPDRYTKTWFNPRRVGEYTLFCTEYCGEQHSTMLARVVVHPSGEFEKWLADAADYLERVTPEEGGRIVYQRKGCAQCHSDDGSARSGPTFKGAFGAMHEMADGSQILVDENYIRKSILEPQADIRAGYKPVMPTYAGQIREEEIDALIAFIKSLQ